MMGESLYQSEAEFDESTLINPHFRNESRKTRKTKKCDVEHEKDSISAYSCTNSEEANGTKTGSH